MMNFDYEAGGDPRKQMEDEELVKQLRQPSSGGRTPAGGSPGWTPTSVAAPSAPRGPGAGANLSVDASHDDVMANYGAPKMYTGGLRMATDATRAENEAQFNAMQKHVTQLTNNRTNDGPQRNFAGAGAGAPGFQSPEAAAQTDPTAAGGPFQSENQDWRGYMKEATRAYAPTLQGIKDEAAREKAVEDYIRSLIPEVQKRGGQIDDVRKEKINVGGKWIDLYRDITDGTGSGAAEAQWLEESGSPTGGMPQSGVSGGPSSFSGIQSLVPTDQGSYQSLLARMQELTGGPGAEQELMAQLLGGGR